MKKLSLCLNTSVPSDLTDHFCALSHKNQNPTSPDARAATGLKSLTLFSIGADIDGFSAMLCLFLKEGSLRMEGMLMLCLEAQRVPC